MQSDKEDICFIESRETNVHRIFQYGLHVLFVVHLIANSKDVGGMLSWFHSFIMNGFKHI